MVHSWVGLRRGTSLVTYLQVFCGLRSQVSSSTSSSTNLDGEFLTSSVSYKLARLLLYVLGGTGRLVHSLTFFRSLTIAHLLHRFVALSHSLVVSLLLECDGTLLFKVLLTDFFLRRFELSYVSIMTLLCILVCTL